MSRSASPWSPRKPGPSSSLLRPLPCSKAAIRGTALGPGAGRSGFRQHVERQRPPAAVPRPSLNRRGVCYSSNTAVIPVRGFVPCRTPPFSAEMAPYRDGHAWRDSTPRGSVESVQLAPGANATEGRHVRKCRFDQRPRHQLAKCGTWPVPRSTPPPRRKETCPKTLSDAGCAVTGPVAACKLAPPVPHSPGCRGFKRRGRKAQTYTSSAGS